MPVSIAAVSGSKANTAKQAGGAPPEPSDVIVSGAGTAAANGTYTYRGLDSTTGMPLPYYNLLGQPDDPFNSSIACLGDAPPDNAWNISSSSGGELYQSVQAGLEFPWEASSWNVSVGTPPAPTVDQS